MSQVTILRTDGTIEDHERKDSGSGLINWITRQIGAECTDSVNLRDGRVMIVNDRGYEVETIEDAGHITLRPTKALLPLNDKATEIYHSICRPGVTHQIVGDVAIAWERDFA